MRTTARGTGTPQPPREKGCAFDILTATPASGYEEIGTVDVSYDSASSLLTRFKTKIAPSVCQLGGDAAIAWMNGQGMYIKATVLKRAETPTPAPTAPPAATDASPKHGCEFDTQCKGDRICIAGHCEAPAAPAPSAAPAR